MKKATKKGLTMWQYMCYMCAILLMVCGITFLLSSCTEEIISNIDKPKGSGKMVEVNFAMNNSSNGAPETVTTRNARDMQPETVEAPLGDNLFMYATLAVDSAIKLRAGTEPIPFGRTFRIVAYKHGTTYNGHADYKVSDYSDNFSSGSLQVEEGGFYKFVAFSYNAETIPEHQEVMPTTHSAQDLLWGESALMQVNASTTVDIMIHHKFSQVKILVTTEDNDPGNRPKINGIYADLSPLYNVAMTVQDGTFASLSDHLHAFTSWNDMGSTTVSTDEYSIFTNRANELVVSITNLQLEGYENPFTNLQAKFKKVMEPGVSYVLKVSFKKGAIWAGSNIYWDGNKLTFDPAEDRSREHYQGVLFKWGSLMGIQPCRSNGSSAFANTTVYKPVITGSNLSSWTTDTYSDWTEVPVMNVTESIYLGRDNKFVSGFGYDYYSSLWGDICQFLGEVGAAPKGYRLPTSNEFGTTTAYWDGNNPGPVAGGWTRVGTDQDFLLDLVNSSGSFPEDNNARAGRWVNVADQVRGPSGATYQGAFFPTSGWRDSNGVLGYVGTYGYYWSSSIGNYLYGEIPWSYNLRFFGNAIFPDNHSGTNKPSASSAMPVRCVKKNPDEK